MHFMPYEKGKYQKNILQAMFDDPDPQTGKPRPKGHLSPRWTEAEIRLRLWGMLRELDTMPVFIPHLEEELYVLLKLNSRATIMERALRKLMRQGEDMLRDWEDK